MKYEFFSKEILKDKTLSDATKVVANYLIHIAGWEEDNQLPSNHKLSETLSINRTHIIKSINILKEREIIIVNEDNTFTFKLNGCIFDKNNLSNEMLCNMMGDFVKAPLFLNEINTITPSARIAAIMFFDWNFGINSSGMPFVKRDTPDINAVATYYGINQSTFKSRIQKCKEAEIFEYTVVQVNGEEKKIVGLKNIEWIHTWVRADNLSAKVKKLQKEATAEQMLEEELMPAVDHNAMEEMSEEEIEEVIAKCDTVPNTNKMLLNLPEAKYNYFITKLKGRDNLPLGLRKYQ